jgi:hypothetical protein
MKRFLACFAFLFASIAGATTFTPIQLLAPIAANTVLANATGSSASPTAFAMPSCSTSTSALQYTLSTGWTCYTGVAPLASPTFTGTPAAPTATAGTNTTQLATTAFTNTIFAAPPCYGCTTAAAVHATTIGATGTITPSTTAGIAGTTLGDTANAGSVGERKSNSATAVSLTSSTNANITSVSLTAGDWNCYGTTVFLNPGTSTVTSLIDSISTTSATLGGEFNNGRIVFVTSGGATSAASIPTPIVEENVTTTTTVYLVAQAIFGTSTYSADGQLTCLRIR